MKLFLKKIGFILFIFVGVSMIVSAGSLWALRESSFYKPSFLVNSVKQEKFDYIILGASTGLTTLNTKAIDSLISTNGINLSMDDTALSTQYLMLQHFLQQGKTTSFCILAPSITDFDVTNNELSGNDYRFLMHLNRPYVYDYYDGFNSKEARVLKWSKWIPSLGVSYYNAEVFYPSLQSFFKPEKRNRFDEKGNYVYPLSKKQSQPITKFNSISVTFKNPYFIKIKTLCKQNNIQLICYLTPIEAKKAIYTSGKYQVINHSDLLKDKIYFFDDLHVDPIGRKISSEQFAKEFKEIYNNSLKP